MIVGLALTISCSEHKLVVLPDRDLPIRPPARGDGDGAPGFEIVAGWEKPYSKYFDYAAGMLSWTDGHDVFVGCDFAHGVGLGLANPPERWTSDEGGIYWTTHEHELWTAGRQRGARVIWRFKGAAYDLALGRTAAYLIIAPAGYPSAESLLKGEVEVQEIWRVDKETGQASRLWSTKGRLGSLIVDGDVVFTANSGDEIRRIDGPTGRQAVLSAGFGEVIGVDDRYVYGADGYAAFRAPKTGGRGQVLVRHEEYVDEFGTRFGSASAVVEGGQIFWIEGSGLRAASVQGGEEALLAAMSGTDYRVVPAGDSVYVRDLQREMIYRVPRRSGPAPVEIPTGEGAVETFTSNGSTLFWVAELEIRKVDRNGTTAVVVAADAKPESALVADDTSVYFTRREGTLWRVPVSGGTPAKIADLRSRTGPPVVTTAMNRTVALRGDDVYFVSFARGAVARIKKSGGAPRILAEGIPGPGALVLDGEFIYLLSADYKDPMACKAKLLRLPASGGKATELVSDLSCGSDVTTTGNDVWFGSFDGELFRVPKQGGKPTPVPIHGASIGAFTDLAAFTASGNSVFVAAADRIMRFDPGRPAPRVVASGLLYPASSMWITGRTMYFIDLHSSKGIPTADLYSLELVD